MEAGTLDLIYNVIGTSGVTMILYAYFALQIGKIESSSFLYSFINLVGAIFLLISLTRFWNLPSVIIEIFWISISIYGLYKWKKK